MSTGFDEFAHHSPAAKAGILHIRSLSDADVLAAARDKSSEAFRRIADFMGPNTNPSWITSVCAETAYDRGAMEPEEMAAIVNE